MAGIRSFIWAVGIRGRCRGTKLPNVFANFAAVTGWWTALTMKMAVAVFSIKVFIHLHSYILKVNQSFATNMFLITILFVRESSV
jgi:hypothetical protein